MGGASYAQMANQQFVRAPQQVVVELSDDALAVNNELDRRGPPPPAGYPKKKTETATGSSAGGPINLVAEAAETLR